MTKGRHHAERDRGAKEHSQQLHALREKWPLAFPVPTQDVRPLALGVANQIAAAMDWSVQYTLGVLRPWKMAPFYCRAVLSHDQRISLDGEPAETGDAARRRNWQRGCWRRRRRCPPSRLPSRNPHGTQVVQPPDDAAWGGE